MEVDSFPEVVLISIMEEVIVQVDQEDHLVDLLEDQETIPLEEVASTLLEVEVVAEE